MKAIDYGCDLAGVGDLDEDGLELDGPELVARDLYHRAITPPGGLIDEEDYGLGVENWSSEGIDPASIVSKGSLVRAEFLRDDRVESVNCVVRVSADLSSYEIDASGISANGDDFKLVVDVGAAGAAMRAASNG